MKVGTQKEVQSMRLQVSIAAVNNVCPEGLHPDSAWRAWSTLFVETKTEPCMIALNSSGFQEKHCRGQAR